MWGETVSWSGSSSYSFTLYHNMPRLSFSTTTKSYFQKQKDRLTNYTGDDLLEVTRVEHIEDRNATVYYTRSKRNGHESSFMTYTILSGDREYIVAEHNDKENESSNYIQIWMRDGNCYGYVYLEYNRAKDRPSITWLSSFGLTPCKKESCHQSPSAENAEGNF